MRIARRIIIVLVTLLVIYLVGPKPVTPKYADKLPEVPAIGQLEAFISSQEAMHTIKPGNEATIVWANDSAKNNTTYAIVYLHGFSASHEEGNPVHRSVAKAYGCNLYLSRLAEHGIDTTEQLLNLTPERYWESAVQALSIGKKIGEKVILMGTSTGATQAIQLAAAFPEDVAGLILYSPNIAINDPNAWLLNNPWGLQIARLVKGGKYHDPEDQRPVYKQFWNKPYRLEAIVALQEMLETTMTPETFAKVKQPVLMLYYYKDELHQDKVVRVSAMKKMYSELGTAPDKKREKALPLTGDHVIASPIKSKDILSVEIETNNFLEEIMHLKKLQQ